MTALDESTGLRSIYEAYQARSFERAAETFSDEAEITNVATGDSFRGKEGYLQFAGAWAAAFPDLRVEVLTYHATDRWVLVEYAFRGTHTGALISSAGFIPPTWAPIDVRLCGTVELQDGRVV